MRADTKEFNQEYGVTFPTLLDDAGYPGVECLWANERADDFPDRAGWDGTGELHSDLTRRLWRKYRSELAQQQKISAAPLFLP